MRKGEPWPFGAERTSTFQAMDGDNKEEGDASRLITSKNFRHTTSSSDATACTRSKYRLSPGIPADAALRPVESEDPRPLQ
jgi:hypothetical protein